MRPKQCALYSPVCGLLLQERPAMWNAVLEPEDNDDGLERFVDAPDPDDVKISDWH